MSEGRQRLPDELELMPPGPQLATLLASVDRDALSSKDRVRLLQARNRLAAHVQGELYADLYAIHRDVPAERRHDDDPDRRYDWASTEIAFALRWTHTTATIRLDQAVRMIEDLPTVQHALAAGRIDVPNELLIAPVTAPILSRARDWAVRSRSSLPQWRSGRTDAGRRCCHRMTGSCRDNGGRPAGDHGRGIAWIP